MGSAGIMGRFRLRFGAFRAQSRLSRPSNVVSQPPHLRSTTRCNARPLSCVVFSWTPHGHMDHCISHFCQAAGSRLGDFPLARPFVGYGCMRFASPRETALRLFTTLVACTVLLARTTLSTSRRHDPADTSAFRRDAFTEFGGLAFAAFFFLCVTSFAREISWGSLSIRHK